jgi:hypothetical protein
MMKQSYCIICGNRKEGLVVKNDFVIEAIRAFKRNVTKNEKGNRLVVCRGCYAQYKKRRDRFSSRQVMYVALGVLFGIFSLLISFTLVSLALTIIVIAVLYALSLLNYTPALEVADVQENKPNAKKAYKKT